MVVVVVEVVFFIGVSLFTLSQYVGMCGLFHIYLEELFYSQGKK